MKKLIMLSILLFMACSSTKKLSKDPQLLYTRAEELHNKGKDKKAIEILDKLTLNHAGSQYAAHAQILLAKCQFQDKNYLGAASEFRRLLTSFPESEHVEQAQYMIAESYWEMSPRAELEQDNTNTALDLYRDFIYYYPSSQYTDDAQAGVAKCLDKLALKLFKSTQLYFKMKDYPAAILYAEQLEFEYPDAKVLPQTLLIKGKSQIKNKDKQAGLRSLQRILDEFPDSEAKVDAQILLED